MWNESDSGCRAVKGKSMSEKFSHHLAAHNHPGHARHSLLTRIAAAAVCGGGGGGGTDGTKIERK